MAVNTKILKRRIKSISNTKKMTKAMEMISAVKMRRAVAQAAFSRAYASAARALLCDVGKSASAETHPLLQTRPVKKIALVAVTSNRGLAGGFNSKIIQASHQFIVRAGAQGARVDVILLGKKGRALYHRYGHSVIAEFEKTDRTAHMDEIRPLAVMTAKEFQKGAYDQIAICYTNFKSALAQIPLIEIALPFRAPDTHETQTAHAPQESCERRGAEAFEFLFEPDPESVLNALLPRLLEMQMYQAILESDASEHSARMMAMRTASDAASDMINELVFTFNQARQASITQEIAEIAGGAAALA